MARARYDVATAADLLEAASDPASPHVEVVADLDELPTLTLRPG